MTPEECVGIGGHCWVEAGYSVQTGDGVNHYYRSCKHCPESQIGFDQPSVRWENSE